MNSILVRENMLRAAMLAVVAFSCMAAPGLSAEVATTTYLQTPAKNAVDLTHVLGPGMPDFHEGGEAFHYKKTLA